MLGCQRCAARQWAAPRLSLTLAQEAIRRESSIGLIAIPGDPAQVKGLICYSRGSGSAGGGGGWCVEIQCRIICCYELNCILAHPQFISSSPSPWCG